MFGNNPEDQPQDCHQSVGGDERNDNAPACVHIGDWKYFVNDAKAWVDASKGLGVWCVSRT